MFNKLINIVVTSLLLFPEEEISMTPDIAGLRFEDLYFKTADQSKLNGWFYPAASEFVILMFHGNAGNISDRIPKAKGWVGRNISFFAFDYRGYGKSESDINRENDLYEDAEAAYQYLLTRKNYRPEQILLYGESLGCTAAVELAVRHKNKGLLLEVPFTNLRSIAKTHYPWVPAWTLKGFPMDNLEKISRIQSPVFFIHGTEDSVCPYAMGQALFKAAPKPKDFLTIQTEIHGNLNDVEPEKYYNQPYQFFFGEFK